MIQKPPVEEFISDTNPSEDGKFPRVDMVCFDVFSPNRIRELLHNSPPDVLVEDRRASEHVAHET
ncbi:hypothetical protein, partial [Burkholderia ubonensis]|uniref:hypothetical protein n=1 Tax=Burkholderia ubonensis TaxID=101571 RepID=UPI001E3AE316